MASDDLDSLFATPPTGFIAERNRIVAALKGAGRKDEAKAVEKIPRPSLAVWTVNRIAQLDPELVGRLCTITDRLQEAPGGEYAAAATEHRQVLADLRHRAAEVLAAASQEAGLHLVQRVIANLRAAVGRPETRALLQQGRLERDVEEEDAGSLFGAAVTADAEAPAPSRKAAAAPAKDAKPTKEAAAEAKAQARAGAKEIATAERQVEKQRKAHAAARKDVERAERVVTAAKQSLTVAEIRAATARAAADAAAQALAQAEADLARLS